MCYVKHQCKKLGEPANERNKDKGKIIKTKDLDQYILAKQIKRRSGQVMGTKQTDQSRKGKLEYQDVATAAIGSPISHWSD